jgi:hypothetical protein
MGKVIPFSKTSDEELIKKAEIEEFYRLIALARELLLEAEKIQKIADEYIEEAQVLQLKHEIFGRNLGEKDET